MGYDGNLGGFPHEEGYDFPKAGEVKAPGTQGTAAQPEYGGAILRFIASIVDGIILGIVLLVLLFLVFSILFSFIHPHSLDHDSAQAVGIITMLPLLAVIWLYYAGFESSRYMGTPGKLLCGLKVTNSSFRRITFIQATIRTTVKMIPGLFRLSGEPSCACLTLICALGDDFAMFTNDQRQCIHDMIAGTCVIHGELPEMPDTQQ